MQSEAVISTNGGSSAISSERIRSHLCRILSSPQFLSSPRLAKFLEFVIEMSLANQADQIKESLIAVEVYERRPDYNPQIDSTVRVEASRLRSRLKQYYEANGTVDGIQIDLPRASTFLHSANAARRNRTRKLLLST